MNNAAIPSHVSLLLEFESSRKEIFNAKFRETSVSIWPHLRTQLWIEMSQVEFPSEVKYYRLNALEKFTELIKNLWSIVSLGGGDYKKSDVLFVVSGKTLIKENDAYSNWLIDHMVHDLNSKFIISLGSTSSVKLKDTSKPDANICSTLYRGSISAAILRRIIPTWFFYELDSHVNEVCQFFNAYLTEESAVRIKSNMRTLCLRSIFEKKLWSRILGKIDPQMIIVEDGSYGAMSNLVELAKYRNIKVVEPQHGWIGRAHGSYNYGKYIQEESSKFLPDHILTFGSYWHTGISHPAMLTPVGKPSINGFQQMTTGSNKKEIALFVSSGGDLDHFVRLVMDVSERLENSEVRVMLRLHPAEVAKFFSEINLKLKHHKVLLDESIDVYESLSKAKWVIGYSSTVLFEALAFGSKPIVLRSHLSSFYSDSKLMEIADGNTGLVELLKKRECGEVLLPNLTDIWADDSAVRISKFFKENLAFRRSDKVIDND